MIEKAVRVLKKYELLVLILVLQVILRLPTLYEPTWYGDENIYLAIGQGIRKGLVLYNDITDFPNKTPFIYLMAAGLGTVFWFRLVLLFWNVLNTLIMFLFLKAVVPTKRWVWYVFSLVFVFLTSLPFWEGTVANAEIFMIMPTTAAFLLLWKATSYKNYIWAGVLLGIAFLFKIPVAMDIAAAGLVFFVFRGIIFDKRLFLFLLGLAVPVGLAVGFHGMQGVSATALLGNAAGSTGYVSVWDQGGVNLPIRMGVAFLLVLVIFVVRKKLDRGMVLALVWLVLALFGALISGRPYPHYMIQLVPALALALALVFAGGFKKVQLFVVGLVLVIGVLAYGRFGFGAYEVVSYYQRFLKYATGQLAVDDYYNQFDGRMKRNYGVAQYLRERTNENERVYVWGTDPGIYVLADRLPVGRLVTSFHVADLNEYERLGEELAEKKPRFIVYMESEPREFEQLDMLLDSDYTLVKQIEEANIFQRVNGL